MKLYEKLGIQESQIRNYQTFREVAVLPTYVRAKKSGILHQGTDTFKSIPEESYIVPQNCRGYCRFFIEKGELKGKKGVWLRLVGNFFCKASAIATTTMPTCCNGSQDDDYGAKIFITPDWKTHDQNGKVIKWDDLPYYLRRLFGNEAHDFRIVGFQGRPGWISQPSVDVLKEAGFDLTPVVNSYRVGYIETNPYWMPPEDGYSIWDFIHRLQHPKALERQKKAVIEATHDYAYYDKILGEKDLLVTKENGAVVILSRAAGYCGGKTITKWIPVQNKHKTKKFVIGPNGAINATAANGDIFDYQLYGGYWNSQAIPLTKLVAAVNELQSKADLLKNVWTIPFFLSSFDIFKEPGFIDKVRTLSTWREGEYNYDKYHQVLRYVNYLFSSKGQRDLTFEFSLRKNGWLGTLRMASDIADDLGESGAIVNTRKRKPWDQLNLKKPAYEWLVNHPKISIPVNALCRLLRGHSRYSTQEIAQMNPYLTPEFLEASASWGNLYRWRVDDCMAVLLRLSNIPSQESWPQDKWPDLIRTLTKLMNRVPFGSVEDLLDYYNMCESLAQLGLHWPIKWNEFHVKNVDYFLSHLPEQYHGIASAAEDNYPRWREEGFGTVLCLLHSIQNEISARARLREEEARDKELDDQYEPWRKQLEKLAWTGKHGLSMFVPTHLAELTYEGSTLHHCVGSYKHSVAKAQEGILFLRRTDTPDKPYFTIDVVKNGKLFDIRQAHGYANSDPSEDVIVALKEWADDTGLINLSTIAETYGALCAKCW